MVVLTLRNIYINRIQISINIIKSCCRPHNLQMQRGRSSLDVSECKHVIVVFPEKSYVFSYLCALKYQLGLLYQSFPVIKDLSAAYCCLYNRSLVLPGKNLVSRKLAISASIQYRGKWGIRYFNYARVHRNEWCK